MHPSFRLLAAIAVAVVAATDVQAQDRKFKKPGGGAMDLSVLGARIRVRRLAPVTVTAVTSRGIAVQSAAGINEMPFELIGYCQKPQKVGSKQSTRWVFPSFQGLLWQDKGHAEDFCQGWNRLVYASLSGTSIDEGVFPADQVLRQTPAMASAIIRDLFPKRHLIVYEISGLVPEVKLSGIRAEKQVRLLDGGIERLTRYGLGVRIGEEKLVRRGADLKPERTDREAWIAFEFGYLSPRERPSTENGTFWTCGNDVVFAWTQRRDAARFCDAVNRLVYAAATGDVEDAFADFADVARAFRGGTRPAPPPDFERHRVLSENALQEKDYFAALEHYEAGLRAYQTWPEGWFNAALLYEAIGEWGYAISRMNRYLELVPDAPDAKAAREKLIIWQEKMRR